MRIRLCWPGFVPRCRRACLGGAFLLSFTLVLQARLAPILRLPILAVWSFSRSLSLSQARRLSARDLRHRTWRLHCICRGRHHCAWRLSCCLFEVGRRFVLDLAASRRLGNLYLSWHLWNHGSFLRNLDHLLKLFFIILTRSFQGVRISPETSLEMQIRLLFSLKSRAPCATGRQCLVPKAVPQSCCHQR